MISESLKIFIEREILPIYDSFDTGHDMRHVRAVLEQALTLAEAHGAEDRLAYIAAAYHDLGLRGGREGHEVRSAEILREDTRLRAWCTADEIDELAAAVASHRASADKAPDTLLGKILADADRECSVARIVERTVAYGLANYPELSEEEQIARAYAHIEEKYAGGGYLHMYLVDIAPERAKIEALLADKDAFADACRKAMTEAAQGMEVAAYLRRIGVDAVPEQSPEGLGLLQMRHLRSVPYENMDILRGVPLSQDRRELYDKIVRRRHGGYCFELNELFGWLLRSLGYHVTDCFARFLAGEKETPMRRHHVLIVTIPGRNGRWLCDVGVGSGSPTWPILMQEGTVQAQADGFTWRLTRDTYLGWVLERIQDGQWMPVFSFTEEPQLAVDYRAASFWCEHAPASPFNKAPMVSLRTPAGRVTIAGDEKRVFEGDGVKTEPITDLAAVLRDDFGIVL